MTEARLMAGLHVKVGSEGTRRLTNSGLARTSHLSFDFFIQSLRARLRIWLNQHREDPSVAIRME